MRTLTVRERIIVIRTLDEWADENRHISADSGTISARVSERIGRDISPETVRSYLANGDITYRKRVRSANKGTQDRVVELAKVVQNMAEMIGLEDDDIVEPLKRLASRQPVDQG